MERPIMISVIGPHREARKSLIKTLAASLRKRGYQETDLILLDNELSSEILKIEIAYESPRAQEDSSVFAIVGSKKFRLGKPEFHGHEIDELADYLVEQFLKTHLLE
jgi:hypothetical protein